MNKTEHKMETNTAVLIYSYDGYSDAWFPFFHFFFKYWSDCPFNIYLLTNVKKYPDPRVVSLTTGEHMGWGSNMTFALNQIPERYVIYFHEDFFIQKHVNTSLILDLVNCLKNNNAAYLRLFPMPGPDLPYKDMREIGEISRGAEFRMSLQSAIWDKEIIKKIIIEGEGPWDMEYNGTVRSNKISEPFLSVREPAIDYYLTAIIKGKWVYDAVKLCQKEGIAIDLSQRPIDYKSKARSIYDGWRKQSWVRKMGRMPILGKFIRGLVWKFVRWS